MIDDTCFGCDSPTDVYTAFDCEECGSPICSNCETEHTLSGECDDMSGNDDTP